jgi:hypothetical protein
MFYHLMIRDIAEILFYSSCIFTFCHWLKADKTKNLLLYFFGYCTFALIAWITELPTLAPFLFTYAPIAMLLFIVLHEKTLQRNLVALCSITPARTQHTDWLDSILSSSLATINAHKKITVIIEHKDSLDHFLTTPLNINADMSKNVLDVFLASSSYDEHKMVWITTTGTLRGINAQWHTATEQKDDALFYSTQCDAFIFTADHVSRSFSLITQGKETKNISAHQLHLMIKKQLSLISPSSPKGAYREHTKAEKTASH